jgi:hypothetical protein
MRTGPIVIVTLAQLTLAACEGNDPTAPTAIDVTIIRSATSFGMCLGYCRSALEVTAERVTYRIFDDRTGMPTLERATPTGAAEWRSLSAAVEREKIQALPGVMGCPDCADGGSESIEVIARDWSHAVTFELRAQIPQLQPLLDQVRRIRDAQDRELRPL